jgi:hypothetical protein
LSNDSDTELDRAVERIREAEDVVDLLAVMLGICRRHESEVLAAIQDPDKCDEICDHAAQLEKKATETFTSRGLSERTKEFAIETLRDATDLAITARALALGIDMAMRSRYPKTYRTVYRQLCAKVPIRDPLKKDDPYPTTSVDLAPMYGGKHGLSSPQSRNAGTAFDSVLGLALWPGSSLHVIYDTVSGVSLDHALGQRQDIDILAVSPNKHISDFDFSKAFKGNKFFGVKLANTNDQDLVVQDVLGVAVRKGAAIVVTPEMSSTTDTLNVITQNTTGGLPPIVIAGGSHVPINGKRLNRLSTVYTGPSPRVVDHDKIGEYVFSLGGCQEWKEDIHRSNILRIHAGTNWSMIPLICADFLEATVYDAVANLCPRLVVVASMSSKTGEFEKSMGVVIKKSQALVVIVNAPHEWGDPNNPVRVPIVVVGMPLEKSWIRSLSPRKSAKPPYRVLISSRKRSLRSVK